jgi:hypothetical protein
MPKQLKLHLLAETFAVNKLAQFAELPSIFAKGEMCFMMRTVDEFTIICPDFMAPNNVQQEVGYKGIKVDGQMNLNEVGVLASLTQPLAEAGIPILAVSTFDTDYIFMMEEHIVTAVQALQKAGHEFVHQE